MIEVEAPDGSTHEFPDGTDPTVIKSAMAKYVADSKSAFAKNQDDQRKFTPPESAARPKWDVPGDIARAYTGAVQAIPEAAKKAFPPAADELAQDAANREKYGAVGGLAKSAFLDPVSRLGSAATIPLSALAAVPGSLVSGTAHALGGSALSMLPGMNKESGDAAVDYAMMGLVPGRTGGGIVASADRAAAAPAIAAADVAAKNAAAAAANPKFAAARQAGYVVHPADAVDHPGIVADATSALGGKIKTQQEASVRNQKVTNQIAAKELGLPPDATLDEATFNSVRGKAANQYKALENTASTLPTGKIVADNEFLSDVAGLDSKSSDFERDFPEAAAKRSEAVKGVQDTVLKQEFSPKAGIEMIRNLRDDARANLKNWTDTDKVRTGRAQRDAADALESLIERNLTAAGNPQAVAEYKAARQMIAKSHDIEAVTDAKGNVDARKLATLGNKRPLTGGLKTIADTADAFPKSMQDPTKFGGVEKHSILDMMTALTSGGAALFAHNLSLAIPGAAAVMGRPLARMASLSDFLQNRLLGLRSTNQTGAAVRQGALPAVAGTNALRQMLPPSQPGLQPGIPMPQQQPQTPQY